MERKKELLAQARMLPTRSFCLCAANVFLFNPFIIKKKYSSKLHSYLPLLSAENNPQSWIHRHQRIFHVCYPVVALDLEIPWVGDHTKILELWGQAEGLIQFHCHCELTQQNLTVYSVAKRTMKHGFTQGVCLPVLPSHSIPSCPLWHALLQGTSVGGSEQLPVCPLLSHAHTQTLALPNQ